MERIQEINLWLVMAIAGLLTYAIRLSFILLFGKLEVPESVRRGLRLVPPAVLSAIIFPELLIQDGALQIGPGNARLLAGVLAALVAWRTKNVVLTILAGMGGLYLFQWLVK